MRLPLIPPGCCSNGLTGKAETRKLFIGLYFGMAMLYIRNLFRFVEFVQATVLEWPPPDDTYVLSEQQVRSGRPWGPGTAPTATAAVLSEHLQHFA